MGHILKSKRTILFLATAAFMLYGFGGMFVRLRSVFSDPLEDMSFGWLVPVFSMYVLWTQRRELKEAVGKPSVIGLLACLPCVAVALVGTRGLQLRLEQVGFVGLCIALPWAFFGRRVAKLCVFPAIYLLFTVPLATFLDVVTIHLRLLASGTAFAVLKGFGVEVMQQGTAIFAMGAHSFSIDVAEPCSGLRSLFALMALTAAYSWYTQPTWIRRIALFVCAIPLAVAGNVVRILTICMCAAWSTADFAMGFYHDYSGYVIFIVAIGLMVACGEFIGKFADSWNKTHGAKGAKLTKGKDDGRAFKDLGCIKNIGAPKDAAVPRGPFCPAPAGKEDSGSGDRVWLAFAAVVILAPVFVFQAMTPVSMIMSPPEFELPERMPGCVTDGIRFCTNDQCARSVLTSRLKEGQTKCPTCGEELSSQSLGERTVLPADTKILKRVYREGDVQYIVSAVIGGVTKRSLHRPELCMPAQGYVMSNPRSFEVAGRPFHAIHLSGANSSPSVLAYTFFNQAGVRTASHTKRIMFDTWDRSVHNRVDRWVMITVSASIPFDSAGFDLMHEADRRQFEAFLARLSETLP